MSSAPGSGDGPGGIPISTKTKRFKVRLDSNQVELSQVRARFLSA